MENQQLLNLIRGSEENRRQAIQFIMDHQEIERKITTYVTQHGGTRDEAKSVFHDSVVAFAKYVFKHRDFQLTGSLIGYLRTIGKYQWINQLRKVGKSVNTDQSDIENVEIADAFRSDQFILQKEKSQALKSILDRLATRCREVLMLWSGGYTMQEIAQLVNYQSEGMARKKKSQCMQALYRLISENPSLVEQLRN